jgi:protein TonB
MTALALPQPTALRWNWPRVGALSGALSLHFVAIVLLLLPPAAMTLLKPAQQLIIDAHLLDTPPPTPAEPPPPKPQKIVHEVRRTPPPAPVRTTVPPPLAESTMHSQVADPSPPAPDITPTVPADVAPTALAYNTRTKIPYPGDAAKLHQQGTVILRVLVGDDGRPRTIEIEKSSGFRSLDNAAREAVRLWTFQAGTHNGIATALWARVPITFTLNML